MNINATLFVQMAVFFVGAWITMKFIWPPLNRAIEERQKKIADGLAAADRGEHALEEAKKELKEMLSGMFYRSRCTCPVAGHRGPGRKAWPSHY